MKTIVLIMMFVVCSETSWAAYQISCPSEGITALNQTNQYTTQATVNGAIASQTVNYDVSYFNKLYNATDCVIKQVADSSVYASLTPAQIAAQMAQEQQVAQIEEQIQANRNAYVDALIAGDTATQNSIAAAQAALIAQKATIK